TAADEALRVGGGNEDAGEREAPAGLAVHEVQYGLRRLRAGIPHLGDDLVPASLVVPPVASGDLLHRPRLLLRAQVREQRAEQLELALGLLLGLAVDRLLDFAEHLVDRIGLARNFIEALVP